MAMLRGVALLCCLLYAITTTIKDDAICGIVAATNIGERLGYACDTDGSTMSEPCYWSRINCAGSAIIRIDLGILQLTGSNYYFLHWFVIIIISDDCDRTR